MSLTDIERTLAQIRTHGASLLSPLGLREGPRPETERALTAPYQRELFTCGYCGGHDCNRLLCGVKQIEDEARDSSSDARGR